MIYTPIERDRFQISDLYYLSDGESACSCYKTDVHQNNYSDGLGPLETSLGPLKTGLVSLEMALDP